MNHARRFRPVARSLTLVIVMVAAVLLAPGGVAAAAATATSWHTGACTGADANAVTVVVDYQDLGGTTLVRCAANLPTGATGASALRAAGIAVTGIEGQPATFACRLAGRPTAIQIIPIPTNPSYTEDCADTPPTAAYWSYWSAAPGRGWTLSTAGYTTSRVKIGGFEGWSFSHNRSASTNPPPRFTPAAPLRPAPTPTITGTARVGGTLTAKAGSWGPTPVTLRYQWRVNGAAVAGATARTYVPGASRRGTRITVTVTASKSGFATVSKTSAATGVIAAGVLAPAPTPAISGTARVGATLTAQPGTWGPAPVTLRYQWRVNGATIPGATARTYAPGPSRRGKAITVTVTASKSGYTSVSRTSKATGPVRNAVSERLSQPSGTKG